MGYYKRQIERDQASRRATTVRSRGARRAHWDIPDAWCVGGMFPAPYVFESVHEELHMNILSNVFGRVAKGAQDYAAQDATIAARIPYVVELLTATPLVNGRRRVVSTMTLVAEDGVWKCGLRDRENAVSLWVSGDSVQGVLDALEKALHDDPIAWRRTPEAYVRNRKP